MFDEPLYPQGSPQNLSNHLWQIKEAYYEFHGFCDFYIQSHVGIAAMNELLTVEGVAGSELAGRRLVERSHAILERLEEIWEMSTKL